MKLTNNHDLYRIEQNNIDKAVTNVDIAKLMLLHYTYLHDTLVTNPKYEDIFNDTYIKLTYNYTADLDFVDRFKYYFNMLKGWYYRSGSVIKYHIIELNDNIDIEETKDSVTKDSIDNFDNLRNAVLSKAK